MHCDVTSVIPNIFLKVIWNITVSLESHFTDNSYHSEGLLRQSGRITFLLCTLMERKMSCLSLLEKKKNR